MDNEDAQAAIAYLLGRAIAAESAVKTLMASRHQDGAKLRELLRANFDHRAGFLPSDFDHRELDRTFLPIAQEAFQAAVKAALRGLSGRYTPPDVRHSARAGARPPKQP